MGKNKSIYVASATESRKWMKDEDFDVISRAWENYGGQSEVIESAIGALLMGRLIGYEGLQVIHSWSTLRKYETILGITFKEVLKLRTPDSRRINGIRYAEKFKQFWKAIAGGVSSEPKAKDVVLS